jgi:hypothetical protein
MRQADTREVAPVAVTARVLVPHVQVAPQAQAGPHWHDAAGRAVVAWQPHLHSEPLQTAHVQRFDWVVMGRSWVRGDDMSTTRRSVRCRVSRGIGQNG